jgi:DNA-binding beta-propeller fold protein YncE
VVNPVAQLISTRLETIAPASKLVFSPYNDVVVATHKSKPQLTLFDGKKRLFLGTVALPSPVATAVMRKRFPIGYFSAVENNAIYEVDVAERKIIRTLKPAFKTDEQYLTKIDALWLNEPAKGLGQLWLMDKTAKKLQVVQVFTGAVLKTITLPNKPLEWVELVDNRLAVLTENNALLTVIDTKTFEITDSITLAPTTKLPFSLTTNANKTELVVFDGLASQLQVIDLRNLLKPVQLLKAVGRSKQGAFYEPNTVEETALSDTTLSTEVKAELVALQGLNTQPQRLKRLERLWAKWQSGSRGLH